MPEGLLLLPVVGTLVALLARREWIAPLAGLAFAAAYFGLPFAALGLTLACAALRRDRWLLTGIAVGMACLVAGVSGDAGGPDPMREFWRGLGWSAGDAEIATVALRKGVHFTFYGLYALLFRGYGPVFALFQVFCLALFDEGRQMGAATRTGSPGDVALDLAGAAAFLWLSGRRSRTGSDAST